MISRDILKSPGFGSSRNIGRPGSPIEEAIFIPPPPEHLMEYLINLEMTWLN
jgi:hypothetical protein